MKREPSGTPRTLTLQDPMPGPPGGDRSWEHVSVARLTRTVDEISMPPLPDHVIMVNLGGPHDLEERIDGRAFRTSGFFGDVAFIPAGTPAEFLSLAGKPQGVDCVAVRLDPGFVRDAALGADVDPDGVELVGLLGGRDPEIERIGTSLLSELENGGLMGDLYADSLAALLAVSLLRNHSSLGRAGTRRTERTPAGGLPRSSLRRVKEYVEENLSGELALAELAGVAHMSPFHFSRMFKLSTGLSPHQYIIQRRVELAKRLLSGTGLPLHEVARTAGFTDQSHLAKHFRVRLGTTPRAFRLASG